MRNLSSKKTRKRGPTLALRNCLFALQITTYLTIAGCSKSHNDVELVKEIEQKEVEGGGKTKLKSMDKSKKNVLNQDNCNSQNNTIANTKKSKPTHEKRDKIKKALSQIAAKYPNKATDDRSEATQESRRSRAKSVLQLANELLPETQGSNNVATPPRRQVQQDANKILREIELTEQEKSDRDKNVL